MDGPTEGSQGPSGSRLRSTRWSSHRILLTTWLVLIAVALGILAFAIAAQIDRSQFTYRGRTVVNPVGTCWRVGVDVDFKDMSSMTAGPSTTSAAGLLGRSTWESAIPGSLCRPNSCRVRQTLAFPSISIGAIESFSPPF